MIILKYFCHIALLFCCLNINSKAKGDINVHLKHVFVNEKDPYFDQHEISIASTKGFLANSAENNYYQSEDGEVTSQAGGVEIFKLDDNGDWIFHQLIEPPLPQEHASFGNKLLMDENFLVVGEYRRRVMNSDGELVVSVGQVYIYKYNNATENWEYLQTIFSPSQYNHDLFGANMTMDDGELFISMDKRTIFDENGKREVLRNAQIIHFSYDDGNKKWTEKQPFVIETPILESTRLGVYFKNSKLILSDTAHEGKNSYGWNKRLAGRILVYEYTRYNDRYRILDTILNHSDKEYESLGMSSFIVNNDIYTFQRRGEYPGIDSPLRFLSFLNIYKNTNGQHYELFQRFGPPTNATFDGWAIKAAVGNNILAIGADNDALDTQGANPIRNAGSVHLYTRNSENDNWVFDQKLVLEDRYENAFFGTELDIQGNHLFVKGEANVPSPNGGNHLVSRAALYVYEIDTTTTSVSLHGQAISNPQITISPNPISDITSIGIPAVGEVRMYLADITGATVRDIWSGTAEVPTSVMMDASGLATGEYFVLVESAEGFLSEKIVVER